MRKGVQIIIGLFLLFNSCKKNDDDRPNGTDPVYPSPVYRLGQISTVTLSGATLTHEFLYTGSTLTAVNDFNVNTNSQIFHHEFVYNGDQLSKIDTYRPSGSTYVLERRLILYYTGSRINKIERYFATSGNPLLSSFIIYSYDGEGKMIQKTSTNQQSWGPQLIAKSDYTYDASGNIKSIREEYPNAGPLVMNFYPVYSNKPNTLSVNNPPLSAFIWNLIDANFFKDGFEEVFLFSKNVVSGTKRDLNGTINDYSFNIEVDIYNNITRISNYPKLYSSSYLTDPVFYDMHLYYLLR